MNQFYTAHEPEPHTVLGLELRPYTLGHEILLHRLESGFVTGEEPTLNDLVSSVFFCALTYDEGATALSTGHVPIKLPFWRKPVYQPLPRVMARWQRQVGEFHFAEKCEAFQAYLQQGMQHPLIKSVHGESKKHRLPSACPFVQLVKATLMSRYNFTEKEVLNRYWSRCLWDFCTIKLLDGDVEIVDASNLNEQQDHANAGDGWLNKVGAVEEYRLKFAKRSRK